MRLCGHCLKEKCECGREFYQNIDDEMVETIIILNDKGYVTCACCSGHPENEDYGMYIAFGKGGFPPREFLDKYQNLKYYHSVGTVYAKVPRKEDKETKERVLYKAREEILQLAKELPKREKSKMPNLDINIFKSFMSKY